MYRVQIRCPICQIDITVTSKEKDAFACQCGYKLPGVQRIVEEPDDAAPAEIPKQVILRAGEVTFYPELLPQTVGSHGHDIEDAWIGRLHLVAKNKGGLTAGQAIAELQKTAAKFAKAKVVEEEVPRG